MRQVAGEFIAGGHGQIFILARYPPGFDGRSVLVVPPFAEEMNKSRKMIAQLTDELVKRGIGVVVPDLFGTGDSQGDFADATLGGWCQDLSATCGWVRKKGWRIETVLGVRLGCALALEFASQSSDWPLPRRTIFWAPVLDGARSFEQFLRLRVAASLMSPRRETIAGLRAEFAAGATVEVAGYRISPQLAKDLDGLSPLAKATGNIGNVTWLEVARSTQAPISAQSALALESLRRAALNATSRTFVGELFWATGELTSVPELLDETVRAICNGE